MTQYNRGDVILVPFPFSDQSSSKKRPAIIISSDGYNRISQDIVIMAVTGQIRGHIGVGEFLIEDWQPTGLLRPSAVKSAISTIEQCSGLFGRSEALNLQPRRNNLIEDHNDCG